MTFVNSRLNLRLAALAASVVLTLSAGSASAQQVTYYNFNTPATANPLQYSYGCSTSNPSSNPLFCFNFPVGPTAVGTTQNPTFIQDPAPAYAVQMTHSEGSQDASMWFSVPQNVANGFNMWFEFRITPNASAYATADGLAFVIQNALSGGYDATAGCTATGQGPTALGGGGGCMGYGGIPNSVALEFDTYNNEPWDSADYGSGSNYANHIALQSCGLNDGAPLPNSPAHMGTGNCLVSLGGQNGVPVSTLVSNPQTSQANSTAVTLADSSVHQVVVVYNGPLDTPKNTLSVYLDPQFVTGTLTPVAGSTPIFTGSFDITQYMNLTNGLAYIGFTSGTGSAYETHEVLGWTFTPHSTVSQTQPLNTSGPTTFNFGTHSYTTSFPSSVDTSGISMGVIANTITPAQFSSLLNIGPTQYAGSACQVYDDTGGNCIIYSTYCYVTNTMAPTACPAPSTPPNDCSMLSAGDCIDLTSAYNNSIQPTSPGYLQGDPLFSPISSISTSGGTATVTCLGECAVTAGQTVTILDQSDKPGPTITVGAVTAVNSFTFTTTSAITQTGGFLTSNNVQDIFIAYNPQNIDGSTTGHATGWSDFVVTSATNTGGSFGLSGANNNTATVGQPELLTATYKLPSPVNANGLGNLLTLLPAGSPGLMPSATGTVNFYQGTDTTSTPICTSALTLNSTIYQATCSFTPTATGPQTITATYVNDPFHTVGSQAVVLTVNPASTVNVSPAAIDFGTLYLGSIVTKIVTIQNIGTTPLSVTDPRIAIVQGGNSNEFITLNLCPKNLAAGKSCYMTVTFIAGPFYTAPQTATLTINDSSPNSPQTIPLKATVINPRVGLSAGSLNFGSHKIGTSTTTSLKITNVGATSLSLTNITVKGADPGDFPIGSCSSTLNAGASCTLPVTFTPTGTKGRSAVLVITDNAQNSPQSVSLSGTGTN